MAKARQNATPLVSICYALVVFAALNWAVFGTGAIRGSHLGQIAGGWLEADATVMAVPLVAQLPWFALMAGLGIYAVWQCMPTARHTDLHGKHANPAPTTSLDGSAGRVQRTPGDPSLDAAEQPGPQLGRGLSPWLVAGRGTKEKR